MDLTSGYWQSKSSRFGMRQRTGRWKTSDRVGAKFIFEWSGNRYFVGYGGMVREELAGV
jgi:hypothetical protein